MSCSDTGVAISPRSGSRSTFAVSESWSAWSHGGTAAVSSVAERTVSSAPEPETGGTAQAGQGALSLSEEEQIGSAKYLPRELPPRVFEEERFIFPETYGVNRVRLLVRDASEGPTDAAVERWYAPGVGLVREAGALTFPIEGGQMGQIELVRTLREHGVVPVASIPCCGKTPPGA